MKAYKNNTSTNQNTLTYEKGQELIWDSGSGYDVVTFKSESTLFNGTWADCKLKTGECQGKVIPIDRNQLNEFSLNKWSEMRRRYDKVS